MNPSPPVTQTPPVTPAPPGPAVLATTIAIALAVLAAFLSILALGRAMSGSSPVPGVTGVGSPDVADVELREFSISPAAVTVGVGGALRVANAGAAEHDLAVDGGPATPTLAPGADATLDLSSLVPGDYAFRCTIPGHAEAGMAGTLTVAASGQGSAMSHGAGTESPAQMQAAMEAAMQASIAAFPAATEGRGAALLEPTVLEDGTKLFELVVDELAWEVEPGKVVDAVGYNGMVPGPTMRVDVGDRVTIRVVNQLDHEGTSLHPHGLKDHDFSIDGVTYVTQEPIAVGDAMDYTFDATEEAVVTYHSHHMSLHQVPNGLFGALVVGDWAALAGIDGVVAEEVMVLNDAGNIGFSLNGKSFPATTPYVYTQGDRVIVHYANEGQMAHPMHLHNQRGTVIAKDGYLLPVGARYQGDTFDVAPGERLTVVYEMDNVGTWVWHCHVLSHVKRSDGSMFGMLTAVIVEPREAA